MSFIVKEVPFGSEIVGSGTSPVIRKSEGFRTGAKEGELFPEIKGTLPDNFTDVFAGGDIDCTI